MLDMQSQLESMNNRFGDTEAQYRAALARQHELQEEHTRLLTALERGRVQVR
jgi:hypothetical protein